MYSLYRGLDRWETLSQVLESVQRNIEQCWLQFSWQLWESTKCNIHEANISGKGGGGSHKFWGFKSKQFANQTSTVKSSLCSSNHSHNSSCMRCHTVVLEDDSMASKNYKHEYKRTSFIHDSCGTTISLLLIYSNVILSCTVPFYHSSMQIDHRLCSFWNYANFGLKADNHSFSYVR